jgi:hypothetical protein
MTGICHCTQLSVEMGAHELFAQNGFSLDPPSLCLLSSWDYSCKSPRLANVIFFLNKRSTSVPLFKGLHSFGHIEGLSIFVAGISS